VLRLLWVLPKKRFKPKASPNGANQPGCQDASRPFLYWAP
jgi:hypothetical protein